MYFVRWCIEPMKLSSCLNVISVVNFCSAFVFRINGFVFFGLTVYRYICCGRAILPVCPQVYICLMTLPIFRP